MRIAHTMFSVIFLKLQSKLSSVYIAHDNVPFLKRLLLILSEFTHCLVRLLINICQGYCWMSLLLIIIHPHLVNDD